MPDNKKCDRCDAPADWRIHTKAAPGNASKHVQDSWMCQHHLETIWGSCFSDLWTGKGYAADTYWQYTAEAVDNTDARVMALSQPLEEANYG